MAEETIVNCVDTQQNDGARGLSARIIAHLDMDAFFANAELVRNPALKGMPLVVGGPKAIAPLPGQVFALLSQYEGRGVLTTANYEARKLGLHSAMPMMKAAKLAPNVVVLPADFEWYSTLSRRFKAAVRAIAPTVEDRGIDEIYIDLSAQAQGCFTQAHALALQLQAAVYQATGGMTCSVGLSENMLTSKICSDLQKPNGVTVVEPARFREVIWPLPVGKINGVGPKAQTKLMQLNVQSVADLAALPLGVLQQQFGAKYGAWLHRSAHGVDDRELTLESESKSIGRETTFERDMHIGRQRQQLSGALEQLAQRLEEDLLCKRCQARTIGVKVRFADFKLVTRDITPGGLLHSSQSMLHVARLCLKKIPFNSVGACSSIRLLGIRASNLVGQAQAEAFLKNQLADDPQLKLQFEDAP